MDHLKFVLNSFVIRPGIQNRSIWVKRTQFQLTGLRKSTGHRARGVGGNVGRSRVQWNVMVHGDVREGKWRGKWRMEWVASTLHTTSEHGVSNISTTDAHTSAARSRLNWRPHRFKWTRSVSPKDKIWFLLVCHRISSTVYTVVRRCVQQDMQSFFSISYVFSYKFSMNRMYPRSKKERLLLVTTLPSPLAFNLLSRAQTCAPYIITVPWKIVHLCFIK